jgi:hypothetical protein
MSSGRAMRTVRGYGLKIENGEEIASERNHDFLIFCPIMTISDQRSFNHSPTKEPKEVKNQVGKCEA